MDNELVIENNILTEGENGRTENDLLSDDYSTVIEDNVLYDENEVVLTSVDVKSVRLSASDSTGLKSTLLSMIGDYETVVTDYTYQSSNGYTNHSIDVQPDYAWCITSILFGVCLWSCFRLFALAFKRGR